MTRQMHVDEIQEPFDLGSGPYFVVQEEDDVPERAVFYDEADARLFIEAASEPAEQSVPLDVDNEPQTPAGRALVEWAHNAFPEQEAIWLDHALAIEQQAAAREATGMTSRDAVVPERRGKR